MARDPVDIKQAFNTESYNTQTLFDTKYIIPSYQREYAWGKESILRLFEDVYQCINELEKSSNGSSGNQIFTFFGTIITAKNRSGAFYKSEEYKSIIDGQQRITTFALIVALLLEKCIKLATKLHVLYLSSAKSGDDKFASVVQSKLLSIIDTLKSMLRQENRNTQGKHYFPRVLREGMDTVSYSPAEFQCDTRSAVGFYINSIIQYLIEPCDLLENRLDKPDQNIWQSDDKLKKLAKEATASDNKYLRDVFKPNTNNANLDDETCSQFLTVLTAIDCINTILNFICEAPYFIDARSRLTSVKDSVFSKKLDRTYNDLSESFEFCNLGHHSLSELDDVLNYFETTITPEMEAHAQENQCFLKGVMELLLFAETFIERVVVTQINASNENYAFSMFDSLNTTGQALTAFETFKAKAVNAEGNKNYNQSPVNFWFKEMGIFLNHGEPNDKKKRTIDVLISFARATTGETLSEDLNRQRVYLNNQFEPLVKQNDSRRDFVCHLFIATKFWADVWLTEFNGQVLSFNIVHPSGQSKTVVCSPDVTLSLSMLKESNHKVVSALLIKFYSFLYYCFDNDDEFNRAKELFFAAVKAVTAFSTIYRSAHNGTAGIEARYKKLFTDKPQTIGLPRRLCWFLRHDLQGKVTHVDPDAFAPTLDEAENLLTAIKSCLINELKAKGIDDRVKWQDKAKRVNIYDSNRALARFMICIDWVVEDSKHPAITDVLLRTLAENRTIEHVAPQKPKINQQVSLIKDWDPKIYDDNLQESLGNLLLISQPINSLLSNRSWEEKKIIYTYFSKDSSDNEKSLAKQSLEERGFDKGELDQYKDGQILINQAAQTYGWTQQVIMDRTVRMTTNIWDFIEPWLF